MRSSPLLSFAAPCAQGLVLTPPQISPNFHSLKTFPHLPTSIAPSLGCWAARGPVKAEGWEVFGVRRAAQSRPGAEAGPPFCSQAWGGLQPRHQWRGEQTPASPRAFSPGDHRAPRAGCACRLQLWGRSLRGGRVALGRNGHAAGSPPHTGGHVGRRGGCGVLRGPAVGWAGLRSPCWAEDSSRGRPSRHGAAGVGQTSGKMMAGQREQSCFCSARPVSPKGVVSPTHSNVQAQLPLA